jgi:hypothetical protein
VIASEVQGFVEALLDPGGVLNFRDERKRLERKFRADTAFSKSFSIIYNDVVKAHIVTDLNREEISFAMGINLENTVQVRNFLLNENYFTTEALDSIYLSGPQKVEMDLRHGAFSTLFTRGKKALVDQRLTIDDEELYNLYSWLIEGGTGVPPRDLLEDDDIILHSILGALPKEFLPGEVPSAIIVTDDILLCKRANLETGLVIWRLPPEIYLNLMEIRAGDTLKLHLSGLEPGFAYFKNKILEIAPNVRFYGEELDTGSLSVTGLRLFRGTAPIIEEDRRSQNFTVREGHIPKEQEMLRKVLSWPQDRSRYLFDRLEILTKGRGNAANWRRKRSIAEIAEEQEMLRRNKAYTSLVVPQRKSTVEEFKSKAFDTLSRFRQRIGITAPQLKLEIEENTMEFAFQNELLNDEDSDEGTKQNPRSGTIFGSFRRFRDKLRSRKGHTFNDE